MPNQTLIISVPQGCGQYFTGNSGTFYSFNYGNDMYLHGMNYGICFRKERGNCGYIWTDKGPSWVGCFDLLRFPSNQYPLDSDIFPYCLVPAPTSRSFYPVRMGFSHFLINISNLVIKM